MSNPIEGDVRQRGITRLCHFTKSSNLSHIIGAGEIRSVTQLEREVEGFRPTDTQRRDGHPDRICCTIEYPNAWYLDKVRKEDPNFLDWVIMTIDPWPLWHDQTKFSPCNAARANGAVIRPGWNGYNAMFAPTVRGQQVFHRQPGHPPWWPTDDQAEVLLASPVSLSSVRSIIVRNNAQAEREVARATHNYQDHLLPPLIVAPTLFDKYQLSGSVRRGRRPPEQAAISLAE
ncbi:DarT ssDNA thymidine ADP-ribosyltransferase family protein [Actinomadura sp. CNU-125]|uniref:DarT ssDNA thymidine ADP-ribosyltransferase family protein n=1 Tax=Actinomadura sp. CNU-125 TaxID=1904961 RepID=UPI00096AB00A|nr:DarT ssDNA thymidine ADP-ribosyltransferase family protein [Actinomadura sp. CNU-125]